LGIRRWICLNLLSGSSIIYAGRKTGFLNSGYLERELDNPAMTIRGTYDVPLGIF
jgi:hypothetical protein